MEQPITTTDTRAKSCKDMALEDSEREYEEERAEQRREVAEPHD